MAEQRSRAALEAAEIDLQLLIGGSRDEELEVKRAAAGAAWRQVRELRERLGIAPFDPDVPREETISMDETARRLGVCVRSVHRLIREGVLPATQLMHAAPWQVPVAALDSESVQAGVRAVKQRRPSNFKALQDVKTLRLPGV